MANEQIRITINRKDMTVTQQELSEDDIATLAFGKTGGKHARHEITYEGAAGNESNGKLEPGKSVKVKEGTSIEVASGDKSVDLSDPPLERVRPLPPFQIKVWGKTLTFATPNVPVKEIIDAAEQNPDRGWIANLKLEGGKKERVDVEGDIDLSRPGIERLDLIPDPVNDGEASPAARRDFRLLDRDEEFLDDCEFLWETITGEDGQRWLMLRNYGLPEGYNHSEADMAVLVPPTYPRAQLYGFFCYPSLKLADGNAISATNDGQEKIEGRDFQHWSRQLGGEVNWNPEKDGVSTHVLLIKRALSQGVGQ